VIEGIPINTHVTRTLLFGDDPNSLIVRYGQSLNSTSELSIFYEVLFLRGKEQVGKEERKGREGERVRE
jgi:hypothetical protein